MSKLLKSNSSLNSPNVFLSQNLPVEFATFFHNKK